MKIAKHNLSIVLLSLLLSSSSFAQLCVETNMAQNLGNSVSGHNNVGQAFTASCAGDITFITIWFNVIPTSGTNLNDRVLHIRDGALCTSPILHTETIPIGSIVVGANVIPIFTPVPINMGEVNSFEITDVGQTSNAGFGVAHNTGGLYPGGNAWFSCGQLAGYDLTFEVSIGAVVVDLGADTSICPGQSFVLDAGNGVTFNWNTGDTTQTITVDTAGIYGVTVIDGIANSSTDSVVVSYFNSPNIDLGSDLDICLQDSICLSAPTGPGLSYMWNDTLPGSDFCTTTAGTYWIACTDSNSCVAYDTIAITANVMPDADITACDTTNCPTVDFTNGSTDALSWNWTFGDGNMSSLETPSNMYLAEGSYTVTLIAYNNCGADTTMKAVDIGCYAHLKELNDWDVSVYPNVNSGTFQVALNGINTPEFNIQLFSTTGELVFNKTVSTSSDAHIEEVNVGQLSNGVYLLKLTSNDSWLVKRIVISQD